MRLRPSLILITMLPLAVTLTFTLLQIKHLVSRLDDNIIEGLERKSTLIVNELQTSMIRTQHIADALAKNVEVVRALKLLDSDQLFNLSQIYHAAGIAQISFIGPDKIVIARSAEEFHFGDSVADEPLIRYAWQHHDDGAFTTATRFDGKDSLLSIESVKDFSGRPVGFVVVAINFNNAFFDVIAKTHDVHLSIVDSNNTLGIVHPFSAADRDTWDFFGFDYSFLGLKPKQLPIYDKFELFQDNRASRQSLVDLYSRILFFIAILSITMLILTSWLIRKVVSPIRKLNQAMLSHGKCDNSDLKLSLPSNEVGDLTKTFMRMCEENRQLLAQLDTARIHSEAANTAKSVFLANMSHEIRTPMNAILGYAQLLAKDTNLSEKQTRFLHTINQAGNHLLSLINEILDLTKIEAGAMQLDIEDFDLRELAAGLNELFVFRCNDKNIQWHIHCDIHHETLVQGDEKKLRQVLINLIGNAVKFTDRGRVRFSIESLPEHHYRFEVQDSGPGIAKDKLDTLFEPFVQVHEGGSKGGTGLGLAISKNQLSLMGSTLIVESTVDVGSRFYFDIELPPGQHRINTLASKAHKDARLSLPESRRALVVDDSPDNRELLYHLLDDIGFEVMFAEDGCQALEQVAKQKPDIVFMDIAMPVMDGEQAINQIIEQFGDDAPPCVAVTASVLTSKKNALLGSGFCDFIAKPFHLEDIYRSISRVLNLELADSDGQKTKNPTIIKQEQKIGKLAIPVEYYEQLVNGLELSDARAIESVVENIALIGSAEARFSRQLSALLENYEFDKMLKLVRNTAHAAP